MAIVHALPVLVRVVWALNELTEIGTIAKLLHKRRGTIFKAFVLYLIADVIRSFVLWWFSDKSPSSSLYARLWLRTEPLLLGLQGAAVIEVYVLLYYAYPGIARFARLLVLVAAITAISLCLITVSMDLREQWKHPDIQMMLLAKRVFSSLAAALLALTLFFFPKARSARVIFEIGWLLSGLLGAAAIGYFVINITATTQNNSVEVGTIVLAVQSLLLIRWTLKPVPQHTPSNARSTADYEWAEIVKLARRIKRKNGSE